MEVVDTNSHAEFSPSSLELFERCPGFRKRESVKSPSAERGTRIHKALETDKIDALPEAERQIAQTCKDFIDSIIADRRPALPDHDYREVKVDIDLGGDISTFGTADRLLIYGTIGFFFDFKTGYREVADAENNAQAWSYVIGAFQRFDYLTEITFYFLVPNRDEVLSHTFARSDVPSMQLRLNTIIRKAMDSDPKYFSPQSELCEYCARQPSCPALATTLRGFATKMKPEFSLPANITVSADRPEDIPHLLRLAPLLEARAKGIKEEALRLNLEEGLEIAGFNRVESTTPRGVNSVIGAYDAVKDRIPLDEFLASCSSVSVVDLEDYFAESAPRGKKGKAREELENRLRHADVLREGGPRYYLREIKK